MFAFCKQFLGLFSVLFLLPRFILFPPSTFKNCRRLKPHFQHRLKGRFESQYKLPAFFNTCRYTKFLSRLNKTRTNIFRLLFYLQAKFSSKKKKDRILRNFRGIIIKFFAIQKKLKTITRKYFMC